MVPTSVERLREGQGVLERVLRGNLKMERVLKRSEGGASEQGNSRDKDTGTDFFSPHNMIIEGLQSGI